MRVRLVALVVLAAAVTAGTGAFTDASADRSVTVSVASDRHAFLGVSVASLDRCGTQALLRVSNRFPAAGTLDVRVTVVRTDGVRATISRPTVSVAPGETATVRGRLTPARRNVTRHGRLVVAIEARSPGTSVRATREARTNCPPGKGVGTEQTTANATEGAESGARENDRRE